MIIKDICTNMHFMSVEKKTGCEEKSYIYLSHSAQGLWWLKNSNLKMTYPFFLKYCREKYRRSEHNIRLFYKRKQCFNKISISMIIIWVWKLSPSIVSSIWFDVLWVMRHFSIYLSTWICTYFKKSILGPDWSVCNL